MRAVFRVVLCYIVLYYTNQREMFHSSWKLQNQEKNMNENCELTKTATLLLHFIMQQQ